MLNQSDKINKLLDLSSAYVPTNIKLFDYVAYLYTYRYITSNEIFVFFLIRIYRYLNELRIMVKSKIDGGI